MVQNTMVQSLGDSLREVADVVDRVPSLMEAARYTSVPLDLDVIVKDALAVELLAETFGVPFKRALAEDGKVHTSFRVECGKTALRVISIDPAHQTPRQVWDESVERVVAQATEEPRSWAYLTEHVYPDGYGRTHLDKPFWIAQCDHPDHGPIALNSGSHYTETAKHHAERLIADHDAQEHAPRELRRPVDATARIEAIEL